MACRDRTLLIVDDNPVNLAVLEELFADDYGLYRASTGAEAVVMALAVRPDLVLLDVMMPVMDGYEVCRRLRAEPTLRGLKVVMVSAKALPMEQRQGLEASADDYVTKPFDPLSLRTKVRDHLLPSAD